MYFYIYIYTVIRGNTVVDEGVFRVFSERLWGVVVVEGGLRGVEGTGLLVNDALEIPKREHETSIVLIYVYVCVYTCIYMYIYVYIAAAVRVPLFHAQTKTNYEDEFNIGVCSKSKSSEDKFPSEDELSEDELPPEGELPPEDEVRRRIVRRRIPTRRRITS